MITVGEVLTLNILLKLLNSLEHYDRPLYTTFSKITLKMAPTALCYSAVFQLCGLPYLGELRRTFTSSSHLHLSGAAGKVREVCTEGKIFII